MKLGGFLVDATKAAIEDAASVARLQQAVENTGVSFNDYRGELEQTIKSGQRLGFTDDQVRDGLAILTAQTSSASEAQKRFKLAMDLSKGANIDVVTASRLLGKVTEENVTALNRYGISVAKGATETELFAAVQAKFGGQAEAFAETTAGKMQQLSIRMGELKEQIGAALLPAMTALADFMVTTGIPWMERTANELMPKLQAVAASVGAVIREDFWPAFSNGLTVVAPLVEGFFNFILDHQAAMIAALVGIGVAVVFATGPLGLMTIAIVGLITAIGVLESKWESLRNTLSKPIKIPLLEQLGISPGSLLGGAAATGGPLGGIVNAGLGALDFRASGGPVSAGSPYIVGEQGPELFVPGRSGSIVPNGGGTIINNNINVYGALLSSKELVEEINKLADRGAFRGHLQAV